MIPRPLLKAAFLTAAGAAGYLMFCEAPPVSHAWAFALALLLLALLGLDSLRRESARDAARMLGWEDWDAP